MSPMMFTQWFCRNVHVRRVGVCSLPITQGNQSGRATMAVSFKGAHCPQEIMLPGVRWSVASLLNTRQVEELLRARGVHVAHSTVNRWVITDSPRLAEAFHHRQRPGWISWRMDETDITITGQWYDLDRAVDTHGQTRDVRLTEPRDQEAARRFLQTAIRRHGGPELITMDGRDAHAATSKRENPEYGTPSSIRQGKYCNHLVEQEHRGVKRVPRPMLGWNEFDAAQDTLVGLELRPRLKTRPLVVEEGDEGLTAAARFDALVASSPHRRGPLTCNRLHTKICDRAGGLPHASAPLHFLRFCRSSIGSSIGPQGGIGLTRGASTGRSLRSSRPKSCECCP